MPTYVYRACDCGSNNADIELNVPIDFRDEQLCNSCYKYLNRKIAFTGLTWAPTAGGMR